MNRFYLLGTAILSFIIPILSYSFDKSADIDSVLLPVVTISAQMENGLNTGMNHPTLPGNISLGQILLTVYLTGVLILGTQLMRRLVFIRNFIRRNGGKTVTVTPEIDSVSFFKWIFIHPRHQENGNQWVLEHERVHSRQGHSFDVLVMEILTVLNWFNPFIYLFNLARNT